MKQQIKGKKLLSAGLALGVLCGANLITTEHKAFAATAFTLTNTPASINLSELTPSLIKGNIEDLVPGSSYHTFNKNKSFYSTPLSINGVKYETGIGTHSRSEIGYDLNGQYTSLTANVGVDDQVAKGHGSVQFVVKADGKVLYESAVKKSGDPAEQIKVNISETKKLELIVLDADGSIVNDHANWANIKLHSAVNLSGLTPILVKGSIEDLVKGSTESSSYHTFNKNKSFYSTPLSINGVKYETGIGTHSQSTIRYDLNGQYTSLTADVGVDDQVARGHGSVKFVIVADGEVIYTSPVKKSGDPAEQIKVNISGKHTLDLIVFDADGNIVNDHANWANAKLLP
ncbi:NPCBM/NEW2 domain-containing protein [Bacillus cereus]|uniref:NPCBM/NEW2 domain-containing protein n=1 Tax=Bacillus cereus TaxID=1396 RepID=UPI000BEC6AAF|nr:NPCBM/NEW2 domain-containing protein [Bacillus cereus]PEE32646.1 hypothetical protein CON59_29915 [Bacillus cereus]PET36034.1 hypothetical protein CN523_30255 [Bacillus cereus]PEV82732.1 hypothetical protein CN429_13410 [Bacillus cereus]PFA34072.1 hypothetical protein CN389_32530 [Bacillus cereus]PFD52286.1 hypothetical protein CN271_32590 [Bacillus cereus]